MHGLLTVFDVNNRQSSMPEPQVSVLMKARGIRTAMRHAIGDGLQHRFFHRPTVMVPETRYATHR